MTRPKYFTPNEVAIHNTVDDLWVSFLGKVYNLSPLCEKYKGKNEELQFYQHYQVLNCDFSFKEHVYQIINKRIVEIFYS